MADFVSSAAVTLPVTPVTTGINEVHDVWPEVSPSSPYVMVGEKFDTTMALVNDMMVRLVGLDGASGYLGTLNSLIASYALPTVDPIVVDLTTTAITVGSRPLPTGLASLITDFGSFTELAPTMAALPVIDASGADPGDAPAAPVGSTITWAEGALSADVYATLLARILADLPAGSTGVGAIIEQEIYDRAMARQAIADDKAYQDAEDYFSARGYTMPPGALSSRLAQASAETARNSAEINGKILIEQADLAQRNTQFVIQQAMELEKLLRMTRDGESQRALDYAKAVVDAILRTYAEQVTAYVATAQAKKAYIEAQVENLRGVVEHNKGLVDSYRAKAEVFDISVKAKSGVNDAIIGGFQAEISGYEAETKALSANQMAEVEDNKANIAKAEIEMKLIIAEIEATIQAYAAESNLKEKVSNDMAQLAAQSVAAGLSGVSANLSMSYSGSESRNESWAKSESIAESHEFKSGINESHEFYHPVA